MGNTLNCGDKKEISIEEQQAHSNIQKKDVPENYKKNQMIDGQTHSKTENPEDKEEVYEETFDTNA